MSSYPRIQRDQLQSRGLALGLSVWIVTITLGIALFFQMQSFTALFDRDVGEVWIVVLVLSAVGAVVGLVVGAGVVLAQRFAPIHPALKTEAWLFGNMGAWAFAGVLYELLDWITWMPPIPLDEVLRKAITGAGVGLGFGFGQWLAARRYVAKLHLLLLANVIGWGLGLAASQLVYQFSYGTDYGPILSIAMIGLVAGPITGLTLSKLPVQLAKVIADS